MGEAERVSAEGANPPPSGGFRVAGRISAAAPGQIAELRSRWIANARAEGARPKGLAAYEWMVRRACEEHGWDDLGDLTTGGILEHINAHRKGAKPWSAATSKLCLCAFKSFDRFLRIQGYPGFDRIGLIRGAKGKQTHSARGATTEEASEFLNYCRARRLNDRRVRGHPDVQAAFYFLAGMRESEPGSLRWRQNVYLDEKAPLIRWLADDSEGGASHKNRTCVEIPMAPELVEILRAHREEMRAMAKTTEYATGPTDREKTARRRIDPDHPEAYVLPWVTNSKTYRSYRDELGIEAKDRRGRTFSAHSARKFFLTTLVELGVDKDIRTMLMRHTGDIASAYIDIQPEKLLAIQSQFLRGFPRLWPDVGENSLKPLDRTPETWLDIPGRTMTTSPHNSTEPPAPAGASFCQEESPVGVRGSLDFGRAVFCGPEFPSMFHPPVLPANAEGRIKLLDRTSALADLLEAAARVIRGGAA